MARSPSGESVLERAVRIFEAFTPGDTALRIADIARRAGLPPATASRMVAELVEHGLLARDDDRRVRVGVRMWELAGPLPGYTEHTITTPARLRTVLADVRRDGHAFCPGHIHLDALAVAVPVRADGHVVAALAVIIPNGADGRSVVPVLTATARGIGRTPIQ